MMAASEVTPRRRWLRRNLIILTPLAVVIVGYPAIWKACVKISYDSNYVLYWYTNPLTSKHIGRSDYFLNDDIANVAAYYNCNGEEAWQRCSKADYFYRCSPFTLMERIHQGIMRIHTHHPTRHISKEEAESFEKTQK